MATVTTKAQQVRIGAAARKVGGYRRLVALAQEKRSQGEPSKIARDPKGSWKVVASKKPSGHASYKFGKALSPKPKTR